jgi:hypothetical protein
MSATSGVFTTCKTTAVFNYLEKNMEKYIDAEYIDNQQYPIKIVTPAGITPLTLPEATEFKYLLTAVIAEAQRSNTLLEAA